MDTKLICNLLARINEALSAREVLLVAHERGIDIRRAQTDPSYIDPITDQQIRLWLDRAKDFPLLHRRMNAVLGEEYDYEPDQNALTFIHIGGPSGGGKTTFALELAFHHAGPIVDGDALHTAEAVEIMSNDGKLTDEYRLNEWLPRLCDVLIALHDQVGTPVTYVCSALSEPVREELRRRLGMHPSIYCYAPHDVLQERLEHRVHPYIQSNSPSFLEGQWNGWCKTQELIKQDSRSLVVDTTRPTDETFAEVGEFIG